MHGQQNVKFYKNLLDDNIPCDLVDKYNLLLPWRKKQYVRRERKDVKKYTASHLRRTYTEIHCRDNMKTYVNTDFYKHIL